MASNFEHLRGTRVGLVNRSANGGSTSKSWIPDSNLVPGSTYKRWAPSSNDLAWQKLYNWSRTYSILMLLGNLAGIGVAHGFPLAGYSWTDCKEGLVPTGKTNWECVVAYHLTEGPPVIYMILTCIWCFIWLDRPTLARWDTLVTFNNIFLAYFGALEGVTTIVQVQGNLLKPYSQTVALMIIVAIIATGLALGLYTSYKITKYREPNSDNRLLHPTTVQEISEIVQSISTVGGQVRVVGSGHSVHGSIWNDNERSSLPLFANISLDRFVGVTFDQDVKTGKVYVTAKGGTHLGHDPQDPLSTWENSLDYQIQHHFKGRPLALPDLGGVTVQTVAGFLSTASAGGTTQYDLYRKLHKVEIIDGTGKLRTFQRPSKDDPEYDSNPFWGVVGSVGLLGVIVHVTFELESSFYILGSNVVCKMEHILGKSDYKMPELPPGFKDRSPGAMQLPLPRMFDDDGPNSLTQWLKQAPYARILWWPQGDRWVVWQARRLSIAEAQRGSSAKGKTPGRVPFKEVPWLGRSPSTAKLPEAVIGSFFSAVARDQPPYSKFVKSLISTFVALGNPLGGDSFFQVWYQGLPMDNQINRNEMATEFTELWLPIEYAAKVMRLLRVYFAEKGSDDAKELAKDPKYAFNPPVENDVMFNHQGDYPCEFYAAPASEFWMSPAFKREVFRVDIFWFLGKYGNPRDHFKQFWALLHDHHVPFRFHWGKWLSNPADPNCKTGPAYLRSQYQMWDKFMALRKTMDPKNVFLSNYWSQHLGLVFDGVPGSGGDDDAFYKHLEEELKATMGDLTPPATAPTAAMVSTSPDASEVVVKAGSRSGSRNSSTHRRRRSPPSTSEVGVQHEAPGSNDASVQVHHSDPDLGERHDDPAPTSS